MTFSTTRSTIVAAALLALTAFPMFPASAQKTQSDAPNAQSKVAAKNVTFGKIIATDARVMGATKANDLVAARKQIGKTAAFQGTVTKVFVPRSGDLAILNFDKNFRYAITAIVRQPKFSKFPDLKTLEGKKVLVSGKVTDYHGQPEIELNAPTDIKLVP